MAVQKRRQSHARKSSRRAQWMKMASPSLNQCPHCGELRLPHRACPSCGQYGKKGEAMLIVPQKEKKEDKSASK